MLLETYLLLTHLLYGGQLADTARADERGRGG